MQFIPEILLWLFVINHGIAFGAGLYEQRIIFPLWFVRFSKTSIHVNSEAMRSTATGRRFWAFVTTVSLTLLTLANLYSCLAVPGVEAGSRYFCESFYGHPCPTSGKNHATANAFGGSSRPGHSIATQQGAAHMLSNDSTRFRKACVFTSLAT